MGIRTLTGHMPMECPEYLEWIRSQPSAASGRMCCIAHHKIGHRYSQRKVSDLLTMPLTDAEHRHLHSEGVHSFEVEVGKTEEEMIFETWRRAMEQGVLVVDRKAALEIGA